MDANINPMQAGLETRAIDFEKGCYVGQEVISKIKYLGQVNRGLVGIRLSGETVPEPGSMVECEGEDAGPLTRSAFGPAVGAVIAFGFLHRKAMAAGTAVTVRTSGSKIAGEVVNLPFYRSESLSIREKEPAS
jgi:folate-binding protein YgfZ